MKIVLDTCDEYSIFTTLEKSSLLFVVSNMVLVHTLCRYMDDIDGLMRACFPCSDAPGKYNRELLHVRNVSDNG